MYTIPDYEPSQDLLQVKSQALYDSQNLYIILHIPPICKRNILTNSRRLTLFAIHTILYVAGYFVEQHQASMKVTDVLLNRKLQWYLENTVVFPCLEFKHELLLSGSVYFAFVLLHGC